jgi:hypothetical protein
MKIRVKMPDNIYQDSEAQRKFIDDVLLWGMETEMDIELYTCYNEFDDSSKTWGRPKASWAVFTVEAEYSYMFSLKWGATLHKPKEKQNEA